MTYNKKLMDEWRQYRLVTCKVCYKRKVKDWNIYKNNICSSECSTKLINKLLSDPELYDNNQCDGCKNQGKIHTCKNYR